MKEEYSILIVEDEAIASYYLKQLLHSLSYKHIYEVTNATDALELIKTTHIDFIFLDINISGSTDGIACAHMINQIKSIPIIYTTAYCDSQTMQEAAKTNMFGYLMKPFEKKDVEAMLYVVLNRLNATKEIPLPNSDAIEKNSIYITRKLHFCLNTKTLFADDIPIALTNKEIRTLCLLSKNLNKNVSYAQLEEYVWDNKDISNSTIRDTIRRLRLKVRSFDIQSIAGFGYILKSSL